MNQSLDVITAAMLGAELGVFIGHTRSSQRISQYLIAPTISLARPEGLLVR